MEKRLSEEFVIIAMGRFREGEYVITRPDGPLSMKVIGLSDDKQLLKLELGTDIIFLHSEEVDYWRPTPPVELQVELNGKWECAKLTEINNDEVKVEITHGVKKGEVASSHVSKIR